MRHPIVIAFAVAVFVCATPTVVSAHTFQHEASCDGLSWHAKSYQREQTNSITVTVDGVAVHTDNSFGTTDQGTITWTQTVAHTWSIVVDAPGTQYDHNPSGAQQPCQTTTIPSSTITSTSTTSIAPPDTPTSTTDTPTTTTTATDQSSTTPTPVSSTSTTSTTVEQMPPPPSVAPILPVTGTNTTTLLYTATALLTAGCALLMLVARRP